MRGRSLHSYDDLRITIPIAGLIKAIDNVDGIEVMEEDITVDISDTDVELEVPVAFDLIEEADESTGYHVYEAVVSNYKISEAVKQELFTARVENDLRINEVEED